MRRGTVSRDAQASNNSDEESSSNEAAHQPSPEAGRRRTRDHSALICALSNLSIQYNFTAVTAAQLVEGFRLVSGATAHARGFAASWRCLSRKPAAPRTQDDQPLSRAGPDGRLCCGRAARPRSPISWTSTLRWRSRSCSTPRCRRAARRRPTRARSRRSRCSSRSSSRAQSWASWSWDTPATPSDADAPWRSPTCSQPSSRVKRRSSRCVQRAWPPGRLRHKAPSRSRTETRSGSRVVLRGSRAEIGWLQPHSAALEQSGWRGPSGAALVYTLAAPSRRQKRRPRWVWPSTSSALS